MSKRSGSPLAHERARKHYLALDVGVLCKVTYIWFEVGRHSQWKTMILKKEPTQIEDIPVCHTAEGSLVPVRMFRDPFTLDPNKLVLCVGINGPAARVREDCGKSMENALEQQIQFAVNEEYKLLNGYASGRTPYGYTRESAVEPASSVEPNNADDINVCHFRACLYAGVKISGSYKESLSSQMSFVVGPCEGIEMGDHLWMACYILRRVCQDFGMVPNWEPVKPVWNVTFSTKLMREEGGLKYIEEAAKNLSANTRIKVYIPTCVKKKGCGYIECSHLESNGDPYTVMKEIVTTFKCVYVVLE